MNLATYQTSDGYTFFQYRDGSLGDTLDPAAADLTWENIRQLFDHDPDTVKIDIDHEPHQQFTSANTCLHQVAAIAKNLVKHVGELPKGARVLDYGGDKYDDTSDHLKDAHGATCRVFDPFNRTHSHNKSVMAWASRGVDVALCANVLNVIAEEEVLHHICRRLASLGCPVVFGIYEGDGKGKGRPSAKGYQRNEKTARYLEIIQQHFPNAKRSPRVIIATH